MKINIENIDEIIKVNKLPMVSSPVYLDADGQPSKDGLFSYETFGRPGGKRRRFQFGYIALSKNFIHPFIYNLFCKLDQKFPNIINGTRYVSINAQGELVDNPDGETGLEFIYENFDKLKFRSRDVKSRDQKIRLLEVMKKDEIFVRNWLVIPPFYYDINTQTSGGARSIDELAALYIKLLSYTSMLKTESSVLFSGNNLNFNIQNLLLEIHDHFTQKISKKTGVIHQAILGKKIDYSVRAVISGPKVATAASYNEQMIPYDHIGIPLYQLAIAFFPLVINEMERYFQELSAYRLVYANNKGIPVVDDILTNITTKTFEKIIKLYARSPENRIAPFKILAADGSDVLQPLSDALGRPFTVTDLLYEVVSQVIRGRFVLVTRYPIEDYRNISGMHPIILTTERTREYTSPSGQLTTKYYPLLESEPINWIESVRPNNAYLGGYGGDYDGDTVSIKALYTHEANEEVGNSIRKPLSLLDASGNPSRTIGKEAIQSIYAFTK